MYKDMCENLRLRVIYIWLLFISNLFHLVFVNTVSSKYIRPYYPCRLFSQSPLTVAESSVAKYAFFLRSCYTEHEYKSMKWPHLDARRYFNLAVISNEYMGRKELIKFREQTIHGSIDDILKRKAPIEMKDILKPNYIKRLCPTIMNKEYPVTQLLIEGAPGIGKSTFAWEMCQKWAQHQLFNEYTLVVLLQFRDKRVQEAKNVSDLFYHPHRKLQTVVADNIILSGGKGVLLILEGFDEAPASKRTFDSIFVRLFVGKELPNATVILTTRPSASAGLRELCTGKHSRRIEILGFGKKEIDEYVQHTFLDERSKSDFNEYLFLYPHIHNMMYVPLSCAIVTHVYLSCKSSDTVFPKTMTQLYSSLNRTLLLRYLKDKEEYRDGVTIHNFSDLPRPVYNQFCDICKIAYTGIMSAEAQLIFQDLPSDFDSLGLMQTCPELYIDSGASVSYNFLHLTIQEYLAAFHISRQSKDEQVAFIREHTQSKKLEVVVTFLAGLTELGNDLWDVVRGFASTTKQFSSLSQNYVKLEILHYLFESQDPSAVTSVCSSDCVWFNHDCRGALPFDWCVLGFCIAHSGCEWNLELDHCKLESFEAFVKGLNLQQLPSTGQIKGIWLSYSNPDVIEKLVAAISQTYVLHNMTHIGLMYDSLSSQTCNYLSKQTNILQHLQCLDLGFNHIGYGGAVTIIETLTKLNTIKEFHLPFTYIGFPDCKALERLIIASESIEVLNIGRNKLTPDSVQVILNALSHNTSLKKLDMKISAFTSENVCALAAVLTTNTTLKELDFEDCNIESSDSVHLAMALVQNTATQLQILKLSNNGIGLEGASTFALMLKENKSLKSLELRDDRSSVSGNVGRDHIGVEDALELIESLNHNTTLEKLVLPYNSKPPSFSTQQDRLLFN